jgi:hypothetical protein
MKHAAMMCTVLATVTLAAAGPRRANADTATLIATGDTFLRGGGGKNQNEGTTTPLDVDSSPRRTLVRVDQAAIVAALNGGPLVSASLVLHVESATNWGSGGEIDVLRMTADWTELGATWNCAIDSDTGNGSPDCPMQWNGGTFAASPTASMTQMNGTGFDETFDVTADVAAFLAATPNYGWMVKRLVETGSGSVTYTSREGAMGQRPRLVLTFVPPTPTHTPTSTATATNTATPTSTGTNTATPTATPTPDPHCGATPLGACKQVTLPGKAKLLIKHSTTPSHDLILWKWLKGEATALGDFGSPASVGGAISAFCIYDQTAGVPSLFFGATIPPSSPWVPTGSTGFKYDDPTLSNSGMQRITLKSGSSGKAKIIAKGKGANLNLSTAQMAKNPAVIVQFKNNTGQCWTSSFSFATKNQPDQFKATGDGPQPSTPTPTNTVPPTVTATATDTPAGPTATETDTPSPSPTPTETIGVTLHKCVLGGGMTNSYVNIYSAAFPVPLAFDTTGSAIDVGGAGNLGGCAVQHFNPIFIIGIGYVCINPGPPGACPNGPRYCGPGAPGSGPALGIDVLSDGNIAACSSNATCSTSCDSYCPMHFGAGFAQLSSSCTGYCTVGAQQACTTDAQCGGLSQGSCNGPDNPGANAHKCQCSCIKTDAFGGSDPGDLQCNLGADLNVEMAPPCNGTDILIAVGAACIPLSTERAHGRIDNANFTMGSTVPGAMPGPNANDQTGSPIDCTTLDASTTTGLAGVGAVNFFGSTIGDLSVGLKATCQ